MHDSTVSRLSWVALTPTSYPNPTRWRELFTYLLEWRVYEVVEGHHSFLKLSYGIGKRLDVPVFEHMHFAFMDKLCIGVGTLSVDYDEHRLVNLYVASAYRQHGIGCQLLEQLASHNLPLKGVWTPPVKSLYARFGVEETDVRTLPSPSTYASLSTATLPKDKPDEKHHQRSADADVRERDHQ